MRKQIGEYAREAWPQWTPTHPYPGIEKRIFLTDFLEGVAFINPLKLNDSRTDIFLFIKNKTR